MNARARVRASFPDIQIELDSAGFWRVWQLDHGEWRVVALVTDSPDVDLLEVVQKLEGEAA